MMTSTALAQTPVPAPQPSPSPSLEKQFFKNILKDQHAIWTKPFHVQKGDASCLAPLGLTTAALYTTDRYTARALSDDRMRINVSHDICSPRLGYGSGAILAAAFYVTDVRRTTPAPAKPAFLRVMLITSRLTSASVQVFPKSS